MNPINNFRKFKKKDNTSFYPPGMVNCLLPISSKNKKDKKLNLYEAGGIYYYLKNKKIILDDHLNTGDLILHTKNILHGVHSVDPQKKIRFREIKWTYNHKSFYHKIL